jgi:1-acylglycerone phosphate reductase
MAPDTNGKTALTTGCTKNSIGDTLAQEFTGRGYHVLATARSLSKIAHLKSMGIETFELDITSSESIASFCDKIIHIDILINNAGIIAACALADMPVSECKKQFEVNVFGTFELTQALIPLLIKSKGIMVNYTSQAPYCVSVATGAYAASKSALSRLNDTWRIELAPFGIRVAELITGLATSNILLELTATAKIPTNSIYMPIEAEANKAMSAEGIIDKVMPNNVYAKKVVSDLLDGWWGPPVWIWRGTGATVLYYVWLIGCHWKGLFDSIFGRILGLYLLAGRLREQEQKQKQKQKKSN